MDEDQSDLIIYLEFADMSPSELDEAVTHSSDGIEKLYDFFLHVMKHTKSQRPSTSYADVYPYGTEGYLRYKELQIAVDSAEVGLGYLVYLVQLLQHAAMLASSGNYEYANEAMNEIEEIL